MAAQSASSPFEHGRLKARVASMDDVDFMRLAIAQAELARGDTGDNPWVGCVIVSAEGEILGRGYTRGPGEHHAEISAAEDAARAGLSIVGASLYSTLEPCSFHGLTPSQPHTLPIYSILRSFLNTSFTSSSIEHEILSSIIHSP